MTTTLMTPVKPIRVIDFAKILPLFRTTAETSLVPARRGPKPVSLVRRTALRQVSLERQQYRPAPAAKLEELKTHTLSIPTGSGTMSRIAGILNMESNGVADLELPPGMPRFVNAATLKRMLKAKHSELLLKQTGGRWEICDDSTRIDLTDDSVEFRLGVLQVFS